MTKRKDNGKKNHELQLKRKNGTGRGGKIPAMQSMSCPAQLCFALAAVSPPD